jgi:hypothetical protein
MAFRRDGHDAILGQKCAMSTLKRLGIYGAIIGPKCIIPFTPKTGA